MAAVARLLIRLLIGLAVPSKVVSQQVSGALLTHTDPPHIWRHQLVLPGEILRVEKLVNLNPPPLAIFHPATSSSPTLDQGRQLVVGPQEYHNVNPGQIDPQQHLNEAIK